MNRHYTINNERAAEIAKLANLSENRVANLCGYDWPEGEEHQTWLDNAPVAEIASWCAGIARDEDAMVDQENAL